MLLFAAAEQQYAKLPYEVKDKTAKLKRFGADSQASLRIQYLPLASCISLFKKNRK